MLAQYFQETCPAFPPWLKEAPILHFDHLEWSWILNYDAHNCIDFHDGISVLHGKNAAGKTNFLEVICIALFGEGFPSRYNRHYSAEIICDKKPAGTMASTLLKFTLKRTSCAEEVWTLKRVLKSNNDKRAVNFHEVSLTGANEVYQGQVAVSAWIEEHIGSVTEFLATAMHADGDFFSLDKGQQRALLGAPLEEARALLREVLNKEAALSEHTSEHTEERVAELAELIARRELLEKRACTSCTLLEAGQDAKSPLETLKLQLAHTIHSLSECDTRLTALHSFSDLAERDLESTTGSDKSSETATGSDVYKENLTSHPLYNSMNIYEDMDVIRSMKGDYSIDECLMKCAAYEWTDDRFIGFYLDAEERLLTNKKLLTRLKQATKELAAAKKVVKAFGAARQAAFGLERQAAFGGDTCARQDLLEQIREKEAYLQECAYPYNDQCTACANHPWRLRANAYQAELSSLQESLKALEAAQEAEARALKEKEVRDAAAADVMRLEAEIAGLKRAKAEVTELERQLALREEFAAYRAERELRRVAALEAEEQLKRSWYSALYSYRMAIAVQYRSLKEERAQLVAEKERIEAAIELEREQCVQRIRMEEAKRIAEAERLDKEIWRLQCAVKGVSEEHEMASMMLEKLDGYRAWYLGHLCSKVNELLREFGVTLDWADGWFIDSRVVEKASGFQRFVVGVAIRAVLSVRYDQLFIDGLDICDAERFAQMPALIRSVRGLLTRSIYVVTHQEFVGVRIPLGSSEGLAHIQHPADATVSISVPSKKGRPPKAKSALVVTKE